MPDCFSAYHVLWKGGCCERRAYAPKRINCFLPFRVEPNLGPGLLKLQSTGFVPYKSNKIKITYQTVSFFDYFEKKEFCLLWCQNWSKCIIQASMHQILVQLYIFGGCFEYESRKGVNYPYTCCDLWCVFSKRRKSITCNLAKYSVVLLEYFKGTAVRQVSRTDHLNLRKHKSRVDRKTVVNRFLKPLYRGNFDTFINNANLGAIAHTSNGT